MIHRETVSYRKITSPFGPILLVWHRTAGTARVLRVILPGERPGPEAVLAGTFPDARQARSKLPPAMDRLAGRIGRFLRGEPASFSLKPLDFGTCAPFQRRVLEAESRVPRGRVTAYGRLAALLGVPGAARAVGNALSRNPFPLIVPCHRCIREDGRLGGFRGGLEMKRALLEMEGVGFDRRGRVEPGFIR